MTARAGLDRQKVIQVAVEIVDSQGLAQLTLAQLANRLGIRTPSLYNHISSLPDLQRELALLSSRELLARFSRAAIGKSGAEAILALAQAYRAYAKEHPGLYVLTQIAPDPHDAERQAVGQETVAILLAVLAPYPLNETQALHTVRALRSLIHGFVSLEINTGFGMPLDLDESYAYLLHLFLWGLEHPHTGQASAKSQLNTN